ncbi:MAG: LysM peptidoglycan-binding domain-containing protein, partial [Methyloligellaceae bacterium]
MSGVKQFMLINSALRGVAGIGLVFGLAAVLTACSGGVSRFDYPIFANNGGDDNLTTASLSPIPPEPVYQNNAAAESTAVVKQDLPPPNSQVASAEPRQIEPAPLPPRQQYQPPQPRQQPYQAPQAALPPPPANKIVRVQKGDTLYKPANRHGVTINEIKSANSLKSTRLSIGQELIIPVRGGAAPATTTVSYTVKRGDFIS